MNLVPETIYTIIEVYPDSGYYQRRHLLEHYTCKLASKNIPRPRTNLSQSPHTRHAHIQLLSGPLAGSSIILLAFRASKVNRRQTCHCKAYPFPHNPGGGKCRSNGGPGPEYMCTACGHVCEPVKVDFGIGPYEYGSIKAVHHDYDFVSDCCSDSLEVINGTS